MTLILRKSGKISERTRWNASFSGISFSHKRGWITLNSRKRSVINLPGKLFTFRVGPVGTFLWGLSFLLFDLSVLLFKLLILPPVLLIDGTHELVTREETSNVRALLFLLAGVGLGAFYVWVYLYFFG